MSAIPIDMTMLVTLALRQLGEVLTTPGVDAGTKVRAASAILEFASVPVVYGDDDETGGEGVH